MIQLGPSTVIPDRPFTGLEWTAADLRILHRMLARLRRHLGDVTGEVDGASGRSRDDRFVDPADQGIHRIVLTDVPGAGRPGDMIVVGFFGQARMDVDHEPIVDLESALIGDMAAEENPLVYYNVHWPRIGWGNLVVFEDLDRERDWGHDPRHAEAVTRSPVHYHSIRLHVGSLRGGIVGGADIELYRTRYLDFSGPTPWRAERELR